MGIPVPGMGASEVTCMPVLGAVLGSPAGVPQGAHRVRDTGPRGSQHGITHRVDAGCCGGLRLPPRRRLSPPGTQARVGQGGGGA